MDFLFGHLKNLFKFLWPFAVFLFCFPCQSLNPNEKSFEVQNLQAYKKNVDSEKRGLNRVLQNKENYRSPIIDRNYFELRADSAYLKGEEAFFEGNNIKALRYFKKAALFAPNSLHLQKRVAEIYEQEGLFAEALNQYEVLAQNTSKNKDFHQKLTEIYTLKGLHKKALKNHQSLLKQDPDNFSLYFQRAILLIHQEDWTEALKALKQAETKALHPEEKAQIILSKSYIFAKLQKFSKSLETMNELTDLQIHAEELILKIAELYKSMGQNSLAIRYLENFQEIKGITKSVSKLLLDYYISAADWKKTFQQLLQIQTFGYFEDHHYFYMAMILMEKQSYDWALVFLKDLVAKEPKSGQYLYFMAFAYEQKQEWLKALKTYNQVSLSNPLFLTTKLQVSQVLRKMGRQKESFSLLNKLSFSKKGISLQALLLYAESLWNSGFKKQALHVLTKGLDYKPFQADLLFLRGLYLKKSGQTDLALKDMNQILEKEKNHEEALNFVASLYSEKKIKLNEAEKMANKALSLKPNSSYFLNTLGWIFFQKGDLKSALHYLKKAFLKNNKDSHVAKRLGRVYLKLKDFQKSEYFFEKALKLEKDDQQLKKQGKTFIRTQAFMP